MVENHVQSKGSLDLTFFQELSQLVIAAEAVGLLCVVVYRGVLAEFCDGENQICRAASPSSRPMVRAVF